MLQPFYRPAERLQPRSPSRHFGEEKDSCSHRASNWDLTVVNQACRLVAAPTEITRRRQKQRKKNNHNNNNNNNNNTAYRYL
jgi:hypothetical protein